MNSQRECAVKLLVKDVASLNDIATLEREFKIIKQLDHQNILKAYSFSAEGKYQSSAGGEVEDKVYMAIELVKNGEMFDYILATGRMSENTARYYFIQIVESMRYCNIQGIAHRDLKPENLLFDQNFNVKIADFGHAALLKGRGGDGKLKTTCGTMSYCAPELLKQNPTYSGLAVDVFSLGVILFTMVTKAHPFGNAKRQDPWYKMLVYMDEANKFWHEHTFRKRIRFSDDFKSLVTVMLAYDPTRRPTLNEILHHPFITNNIVPTHEEIFQEFTNRKLQMLDVSGITSAEDEQLIANMKAELGFKTNQQEGDMDEEEVMIVEKIPDGLPQKHDPFNKATRSSGLEDISSEYNKKAQYNIAQDYLQDIEINDWAVTLKDQIGSKLKLTTFDKTINFQPNRVFTCKSNTADFVLVTAFVCRKLGFSPAVNLDKSKVKIVWNNGNPDKTIYKDLRVKIKLHSLDESHQTAEFIKMAGGLMEFLEFIQDFKLFSKQIIDHVNKN